MQLICRVPQEDAEMRVTEFDVEIDVESARGEGLRA